MSNRASERSLTRIARRFSLTTPCAPDGSGPSGLWISTWSYTGRCPWARRTRCAITWKHMWRRSYRGPTSRFTWSRAARTVLAVGGGDPTARSLLTSRRPLCGRHPRAGAVLVRSRLAVLQEEDEVYKLSEDRDHVDQEPPSAPAGIVKSPDGNGQRGYEDGQAIESVEDLDVGTGHDSFVDEIEDEADN